VGGSSGRAAQRGIAADRCRRHAATATAAAAAAAAAAAVPAWALRCG